MQHHGAAVRLNGSGQPSDKFHIFLVCFPVRSGRRPYNEIAKAVLFRQTDQRRLRLFRIGYRHMAGYGGQPCLSDLCEEAIQLVH